MRFAHVRVPAAGDHRLAVIQDEDAIVVEDLFAGAPRQLEELIGGGDELLARVRARGDDVVAAVAERVGGLGGGARGDHRPSRARCRARRRARPRVGLHRLDPDDLHIWAVVDGRTMQDASTGQMIRSVAALVSYLSRSATLLPGTLISTGSPGGAGYSRDPQVSSATDRP